MDDRFSLAAEERAAGVETRLSNVENGTATDPMAEMRSHFRAGVERMDEKFDLLCESIVAIGDKVDRRFSEISDKMDRGFADTCALLKSLSAKPDRGNDGTIKS